MPISPEQVLPLNEEEQAHLAQAEELVDAMLERAKAVPYVIHAEMTKDGAGVLHLVKDNKPYFVVCSEQVVCAMLIRYKKAGWDICCIVDSMHVGTYLYEGRCVQRGKDMRIIFTVHFRTWTWENAPSNYFNARPNEADSNDADVGTMRPRDIGVSGKGAKDR